MQELYDLKLLLAGEAEPVYVHITEEDADRLDGMLLNHNAEHGKAFFVWDVPGGGLSVLSLQDLQLVNMLWDGEVEPPAPVAPVAEGEDEPPGDDDDAKIEIRLRGRAPFQCYAAHMEQLADIEFYLELGPDGFLMFQDEDGERVWFSTDQLVYLSIPKWMIEEGRAELNKELEAEQATEAAAVATAKPAKAKRPRRTAVDPDSVKPSGQEA